MRVLFLCSNGKSEASMRFRVLQFQDALRAAGHESRISSFFDERLHGRVARAATGSFRRVVDWVDSRRVDRVFIHRESFPLSLNGYMAGLSPRVPVIFDFDDSVHLPGEGWRVHVSRPASTRMLVERADITFAGNSFLADYASQFSNRVRIVPTVVDTDVFRPRDVPRSPDATPIVGWIGAPSTANFLDAILPILDEVAKDHRFILRIVGAGRDFTLRNAPVENLPWTLATEVSMFQDLDVGLYPLDDDPWARGKCGFKAIQYMACGVPFVVSPVGVAADIVRDGVDGFWATTPEAWSAHLRALLADPALRTRMGSDGRVRAVRRFSVEALTPLWIDAVVRPEHHAAQSGPLTGYG
ncbi:MAG: glycosyltransferase family 4 protein [Polyangiaceae bacterium]